MPNNYFQFKQFTVQQEHCAMKVCTDACLFGAWVGSGVRDMEPPVERILDIGTGTGLLSLMLAQASVADIDAVEIDPAAAGQALENFAHSPWKDRFTIHTGDIRALELPGKYGLVIANPPFFENNLRSADAKRNLALHSEMLRLEELVSIAAALLTAGGRFAVLLPFERKNECILAAGAHGLFLSAAVDVRQDEKHGYFRIMLCFTRRDNKPLCSWMSIREKGQYSDGFSDLLREYYLHL